ncbi:acetyl-CoA carboxylase biotin carboxyl carrier protein [Actinomadura vinacea]
MNKATNSSVDGQVDGQADGQVEGTAAPDGPVADPTETLESACRSVLGLIEAVAAGEPRRIAVHVDRIGLEIEWPGRDPAGAGAETVHQAATGAVAPSAAVLSPAAAPQGPAPQAAAARGAPAAAGDAPAGADHQVKAANVGTFYRRSDPSAEPFVEVGDRVEAGGQVGIVEAMKLMIPVEAPVAGTVTAIHAEDGAPVEYDQPLLSIRPVT